ncbi:MAG: methylated-DNA--[protein]-cysteine S-methyltransferase [Gammaproteobacteria bacterium]|nr:methylated-DNA--[protein]-cysteine S-methyltransferase [Gammaproteobacteria bacterium]
MESCILQSPLGPLRLTISVKGLQRLEYVAAGSPLSKPVSDLAKQAGQQLMAYFEGDCRGFDLPFDLIGTCYQKQVWSKLQQLYFGQTLSYGELAEKIDSGARAVGNACRSNPLLIIVPCHRVLRKDAVGGYSGQRDGIMMQRKLWLLQHEAETSQQS